MTKLDRRQLLKTTGAAAALTALPALCAPAIAQARAKVIVIGGGPGGATAAKYIAKDAAGKIEVTLIEPGKTFTTCFHSNLYMGGYKTLPQITHSYDKLKTAYGIRHVPQMAAGIDRAKKTVRLAEVGTLSYDRLIVAPGIDIKFDSVPGYSEAAAEQMPHAWKPGPQLELLKSKLDALADGATLVMICPPNPYRCPPGPYERVSMFAHVLKAKGHTKTKIIVLDTKETFSKQALFAEAWQKHYPGMIEWQDPKVHGGIKMIDPATGIIKTDLAEYKADLCNVIPAQMAGKIARDAGLAPAGGFCAIKPESMQSAVDDAVFVLGDASIAGDMPKSAFSANSQAKVAAMTVRAQLIQSAAFPARYTNTCWSLLETDDTVKVGGRYEPKDGKISAIETFVSKTGETPDVRKQTSEENIGWYEGITADIFS
jgi:NADPH-dependent 2,4-dienoyl-CoA reductase/sulfur reductase-like enzyme